MNKSLFEISKVVNIDSGKDFNVWNGDNVVLPASFNPGLFQVEFNCQVSRYVEEEEANIITDEIMVYAIVEHGFIIRIDWDVWYSDNDYGVLNVGGGSIAWHDELVQNTLQVIINHVRVECGIAVWEQLKHENNVDMSIDY